MTFRKNWLSILIWIPFALLVCAIFGMSVFQALPKLSFITNGYLQIVFTLLAFLLAVCVCVCVRKMSKKKMLKNCLLAEAFGFTLLLGIGVFIRCFYLYHTKEPLTFFEEAAFFESAKVTGGAIVPVAHGAQYFYLIVLRGLFWLFGNHFMVGIILQIVLQCLSCSLWYLAIRKISGFGAGLLFLAGMMVLPESVLSGLTYSPKYLYLLLAGFAILFLAKVLKSEYQNHPFKWYTCISRFILGAFIGLLVYMDITGFLLLIPVMFLICLGKNPENVLAVKQKCSRVILQIITILLGTGISWNGLLLLDANRCGSNYHSVKNVWFTLYAFKGYGDIPAIFTNEDSVWAYIGVLFLLVLGAFAFFFRKRSENQLLWMFMVISAFVIHFCGFNSTGMSCDMFLLVLVLALTGAGIHALTQREGLSVVNETEPLFNTSGEESEIMYQEFQKHATEASPVMAQESSEPVLNDIKEPEVQNETTSAVKNSDTEDKPQFIENPLPLPKKHVKKTMDYGIEIPPEQMGFDIETSDMDDFDVL